MYVSSQFQMCTPEQLEEEFKGCLELTNYMLTTLGLIEDVSYRFSQWDPDDREKYIGTEEQWNEAQDTMEKILKDLNIDYKVGVGEAAFYGPKLDIQIKNVHGKEDTLVTIQIDQMLAEKFGMEYVDKDGTKKNPYITKEHLHFLSKSMQVHSRYGLLLYKSSFCLLRTDILIMYMKLRNSLRQTVFCV